MNNEKYTTDDVEKFLNENSEENTWANAVEKFGQKLIDELFGEYKKGNDEQLQAYWDDVVKEQEERLEINEKEIENVKSLIDYDFELIEEYLEDNDWWKHIGYVEVIKSDYKNCFYPSYDFYIEKGLEKTLHCMRQDDSEDNTFHVLVYQTDGGYGAEDSYFGYLLFPLTNGKYWKIQYQC